jgi:signal transduction histidine kinase
MNGKGSILIIDDEAGMHQGCRRVLAPEGYRVISAYSVREGEQKFEAGVTDLILLDLMLPDGSGFHLLQRMLARDPDVVVIVISGYATAENAVQALKWGAYDFLAKPFTADLLLLAVKRGLERKALTLETRRLKALEKDAAAMMAVARQELERLDKFKQSVSLTTAFTLTVAHEFRAPITALQSFLNLLYDGYVTPDKQKQFIELAIDRSQGLLDLVDDLLYLATAREEMAPQHRVVLSLADTMEKVGTLMQAQAEKKGIGFTVQAIHRPVVKANPEQIHQVWSNLISNAIKYTGSSGSVSVVVEEREGFAIGTVEDTGIGIGPDEQERVFMEFYRSPRAKDIEVKGTGLGLALVKRIIDGYHGTVVVESALNKGSRFRFMIPVANTAVTNNVQP